ncbi:MAG: 2-phosphosulfolactate phosphatase [Verrucomicrobia bacterium]|nr:MAG: 2-phosphosulfolactate phosphatase [Verrucomicrobiota bacterium]
MKSIEVLFTPADFQALRQRDLSEATCVVFDVLRATTTLVTALANGALAVAPAADIPEALARRAHEAGVLLAGERDGLRIRGTLAGGVDFDLGNSPREFGPERIGGKRIAMTTTNGTRALRACAGAAAVLPASLRNVGATAAWVARHAAGELLVVCSGTHEDAAYEDVLGAGALVDRLWAALESVPVMDSARLARNTYRSAAGELAGAMASHSRNARRLLAIPDLAPDVATCAAEDDLSLVARLDDDGWNRLVGEG